MTDITERLRLRNDPSQMLMSYPARPAPDMLCYEAAAEIERLRAALQEIAGHKISGVIPDDYNVRSWTLHNYVEIREIARNALEGEKTND